MSGFKAAVFAAFGLLLVHAGGSALSAGAVEGFPVAIVGAFYLWLVPGMLKRGE